MSWHRWRETRRVHRNSWTCSRNNSGSRKRAHDLTSRMPERARTDLWEPRGSNPRGDPAPNPSFTRLTRTNYVLCPPSLSPEPTRTNYVL